MKTQTSTPRFTALHTAFLAKEGFSLHDIVEAHELCEELEGENTTLKRRLEWLEKAIEHMPDLSISFQADFGEEDDLGVIPTGWNIRCPSLCAEPLVINAPTFAEAVDSAEAITSAA